MADKPKLDELMMAMDVVDTLRREEQFVEKQLAQSERDDVLKDRLKTLYEGQGLEVSAAILDEGIAALREQRFTYVEPEGGAGLFFAKLWVRRRVFFRALLALVVLIAAIWGWTVYREAAARQAEADRITTLSETLPGELQLLVQRGAEVAATDKASNAIAKQSEKVKDAIAAPDIAKARLEMTALRSLIAEIALSYKLVIVSRPGEKSGVFRIYDNNQNSRNYYLIVEAIDGEGNILTRSITSEEDGTAKSVTKWAERVPRKVYEAVGQDKQNDGIIQNNLLGVKERGALDVNYLLAASGAQIHKW